MNFDKEIDYIQKNGEESGTKMALTELFGEAILLKKKIHTLKMVRFYHLINNAIIDSGVDHNSIKSCEIIDSEDSNENPKSSGVVFFDIVANTDNKSELRKISNIKKVVNMELQGLGLIDTNKFEADDEFWGKGTITINYKKDTFKDSFLKATVRNEILVNFEKSMLEKSLPENTQSTKKSVKL